MASSRCVFLIKVLIVRPNTTTQIVFHYSLQYVSAVDIGGHQVHNTDIQKEYKGREAFKHEARNCHFTLYAVYYVTCIHLKTLYCTGIDTREKVQLSPVYSET